MNVYILLLTYQVPVEKIMEAVPAHRDYLEPYDRQGDILLSGMQSTQKGGVIIMRAANDGAVQQFIEGDPFHQRGLATYEIIHLDVRRHQGVVSDWLSGKFLN
ncbi:YciI family protein [Deltaproteobacteria bacterium TL4]